MIGSKVFVTHPDGRSTRPPLCVADRYFDPDRWDAATRAERTAAHERFLHERITDANQRAEFREQFEALEDEREEDAQAMRRSPARV